MALLSAEEAAARGAEEAATRARFETERAGYTFAVRRPEYGLNPFGLACYIERQSREAHNIGRAPQLRRSAADAARFALEHQDLPPGFQQTLRRIIADAEVKPEPPPWRLTPPPTAKPKNRRKRHG